MAVAQLYLRVLEWKCTFLYCLSKCPGLNYKETFLWWMSSVVFGHESFVKILFRSTWQDFAYPEAGRCWGDTRTIFLSLWPVKGTSIKEWFKDLGSNRSCRWLAVTPLGFCFSINKMCIFMSTPPKTWSLKENQWKWLLKLFWHANHISFLLSNFL